MMTKIFIGLTVLSLLGAGVLWWLLQTTPATTPKAVAVVTEPSTQVDDVLGDESQSEESSEASGGQASSESHSAAPAETASKLTVVSEPEGADVWVDGEKKGTAPVEIELQDKEQSVVLKLKGHADFERKAPALSAVTEESGALNWKIQMKEMEQTTEKSAEKSAKKASVAPVAGELKSKPKVLPVIEAKVSGAPNAIVKLSGLQGPAFVQIRAFDDPAVGVDEFAKQMASTLSKPVALCLVEIPGKGRFTRVLIGPMKSRREAMRALDGIKQATLTDAFVTGAQQCVESAS